MTTYKALLIGAGGWGRTWGEVIDEHPDVELAAWVDTAPEFAQVAADKLGLENTFVSADLDEALKKVTPDFVVDVSPHFVHPHNVIKALEFGVPVLGEKPMAGSLEEAHRMIAASEKAGKLYMVSQSRRFDARIDAFRDLIRDHLGTLGMLKADFYKNVTVGGYRMDIPDLLLLDMAIHTFDQARYMMNNAEAETVYCEQFNPSWRSADSGFSSANALFEMDNGVRFTYIGSWAGGGMETSWESSWRAVGSNGTAIWDGEDTVEAAVIGTSSEGEVAAPASHAATWDKQKPLGIRGSLRAFIEALETGETPEGECHDNIKSLAMVFAAIESSQTGKRVKVKY